MEARYFAGGDDDPHGAHWNIPNCHSRESGAGTSRFYQAPSNLA